MTSGALRSLKLASLRFFSSFPLTFVLPVKNKLGMNGGLGRGEDLLKDAIDLFIPEIICMAWQPQHHPLSTSAKSQAAASWV